MVNVILEFCPPHLELLDLLVRGEIDFFFDAVNLVIEPVVLIEYAPEVIVRRLQPTDDVTIFRELSQDWMMKVHGDGLLLSACCELRLQAPDTERGASCFGKENGQISFEE
jgi:hypothetical protein